MIDYNHYLFTKKQEGMIVCAIVLLGIVSGILFYRNILFGIVVLPFVRRIKEFIREELKARRLRALTEQFKDTLFMISTSIGAGRGMKDAMGEAVAGIAGIYGEDALMTVELKEMHQRMEERNEEDLDVLMDFALRSGLEDVVDFVTVYATCKKTGASLMVALNRAAGVIIDKMTIENEIRAIVAGKRSEGLILFLMPVIVLFFLNLSAPDYVAPLYETTAGRIIMTGTIAANIAIYSVMKKIVQVET